MKTEYIIELARPGDTEFAVKATYPSLSEVAVAFREAARDEGATDVDLTAFMLALLMDKLQGVNDKRASLYLPAVTIHIRESPNSKEKP